LTEKLKGMKVDLFGTLYISAERADEPLITSCARKDFSVVYYFEPPNYQHVMSVVLAVVRVR